MLFTEIVPVLTDEMLDDYLEATENSADESLDSRFRVKNVIPSPLLPKNPKQLLCSALYWRRNDPASKVRATEFRMKNAGNLGLAKPGITLWENLVSPFLENGLSIRHSNPNVEMRIYLSSEFDFLIDDLSKNSWNVYLMEERSQNTCVGDLWPFLASDKELWMTVLKPEALNKASTWLRQTSSMVSAGGGMWRMPKNVDGSGGEALDYRPVNGNSFGIKGRREWVPLAGAFLWYLENGGMLEVSSENPSSVKIHSMGIREPNLDELFLMTAIYPRVAFEGIRTLISRESKIMFLAEDMVHQQKMNSRSEFVYC